MDLLDLVYFVSGLMCGFIAGICVNTWDRHIKREENDFDNGELKILIQRKDGERRWITIETETWTVVALAKKDN